MELLSYSSESSVITKVGYCMKNMLKTEGGKNM